MMPSPKPAFTRPPYVRRDRLLFIRRAIPYGPPAAPLPGRCVKCGQRSTYTLAKTFYWHPRWVNLLFLVNVLLYAIVALAMRKKIAFGVPLCEAHRARRRNLILAAWLIPAAGVATPILLAAAGADAVPGLIVLFLSLVVGAVMGAVVSQPLLPTLIDDDGATFKGCSEEFLRQLP